MCVCFVLLLKIHYAEKLVASLTGWFSKQNVGALCRRRWFESRPSKTFRHIHCSCNSKIIIISSWGVHVALHWPLVRLLVIS